MVGPRPMPYRGLPRIPAHGLPERYLVAVPVANEPRPVVGTIRLPTVNRPRQLRTRLFFHPRQYRFLGAAELSRLV